jgi:hypothetical protein
MSEYFRFSLGNHEGAGHYRPRKILLEVEHDYLGIRELVIGGLFVLPMCLVVLQGTWARRSPSCLSMRCLAANQAKHLVIILIIVAVSLLSPGFCFVGTRKAASKRCSIPRVIRIG